MKTTTAALAAALTFSMAAPLSGQDTEAPQFPQTLIVASFICPMASIGDIAEAYEAQFKPVDDELVAEGALAGAGLYFHAWGDEWNVHYYRLGNELTEMMEAIQAGGQRVFAQNPEWQETAGPFGICTAHKDNIYVFGPGTGRPGMFSPAGGGN